MADKAELDALEARAAELYKRYQEADRLAAFHDRQGDANGETFHRQADAWKDDYIDAVRNLRRARG